MQLYDNCEEHLTEYLDNPGPYTLENWFRQIERYYESDAVEYLTAKHEAVAILFPALEDLQAKYQEYVAGLVQRRKDAPVAKVAPYRPKGRHGLHDVGNAGRMAEQHGENIRYCHQLGKWLLWDGKRWKIDDQEIIETLAKATARTIYLEAADCVEAKLAQAIALHANRTMSRQRLDAMMKLTHTEPGIPVRVEALDQDLMQINCLDGTIDITDGSIHDHHKPDLLTKMAPVRWGDELADCPKWKEFLLEVMAGRQELVDFLQRAVGYSLTGSNAEQVFFILYGLGANGKSTFINTIMDLLGQDYALQTPTSTLLIKKNDGGIPNDIARLRGVRFVSAFETEEGKKMAESLLKQITGGERITARFLHKEFFEFTPNFKIWLGTNHKPIIRGTDMGIWRRVRLIPWEVQIPEERRIKDYHKVLLATEAPGILKWALEGAIYWQTDGLGLPAEVQRFTEAYRTEMNPLERFIADCCIKKEYAEVQSKKLYSAFDEWSKKNQEFEMSPHMFGRKLVDMGIKKKRTMEAVFYQGIAIRNVMDDEIQKNESNEEKF